MFARMDQNDTGGLKRPDHQFLGGAVQFVTAALEVPHGAACDARALGQMFLRPIEKPASGPTLFR
jgi:hypothetical protein